MTYYNQLITNNTEGNGGVPLFTATPGPTAITNYAAGVCTQPINSHSDWYLPAICEMGYYNPDAGGIPDCGLITMPLLQNIQSSLREMSGFGMPSGVYWSSTEDLSDGAQINAWTEFFDPPITGFPGQFPADKNTPYGVRCVRIF